MLQTYRPLTCTLSSSHFLGGLPGCRNLASFKGCVCILEALPRLLPCATSHDPDLSQSLSVSQKHIVLLDRRDGARSRIKPHCVPSKNTEKGGRIPPFSELQQLQRPGVLYLSGWPWLQTREHWELKQGRCQQII